MSKEPSILAVTSELPWPLDTGGHLRTYHLLRALVRRFRVRLVAGVTAGSEKAIEEVERAGITVHTARLKPRAAYGEACRSAAAALRREPYVLYRRHDRSAMRKTLREALTQYPPDLLYLDHLDSFMFAGLAGRMPVVGDLHNVYSRLARRTAREEYWGPSRWYLLREARLLEAMERRAAGLADALLTVSEDERRYFSARGARTVHVVPNGVDCGAYADIPTARRCGPPTILCIGSLSWKPNASAAHFLASDVLPRVRSRMPEARLRIVGRAAPSETRTLAAWPGVEITGAVADVRPHLQDAHVLAVPLESGGGTRLKILEAFAAGLPVVTTSVGCEGLEAIHDQHVVVAPRAAFSDAVISVLTDRELAFRLAAQARRVVRHRYDWAIVGETVCSATEATLCRPAQSRAT